MEIPLAKSPLTEVYLLKHVAEPNVQPRNSVCASRGIHFVDESCFVLGFGRREWLIESGTAFLTEFGRVHRYSHLRGAPADVTLSVRFTADLMQCMTEELPEVDFVRLEPVVGKRNDLRFLRWRLQRMLREPDELAMDEWVIDLVTATCLHDSRAAARNFPDVQLRWYAERIEAVRQELSCNLAVSHRLPALARSVGMSTFLFARAFRELVGTAPHQYLLAVRYRAAVEMLLAGASVTDACFQCGFSNLSHFTRRFKARFGESPSHVKTWPRHLRHRRFFRR